MENIDNLIDEISDLMAKDLNKASAQEKKEILDKINHVLELDPVNTDALFWKGMYYYLDDYDKAISIFEQILEINPDCSTADIIRELIGQLKEFKNVNESYANVPDFLEKVPCELILALKIVILLIAIFIIFKPLIFSYNDNKVLKARSGFQNLRINPPSEFNNMRKDEIYRIRESYVKDSLFASENYKPNESVFGQIQDYKPWWGTIICQPIGYEGDYHENIEGESQQSIQINNPNALIGLKSVYFMYDRHESDFCTSDYAKFIPQSLKYSKQDNLIVAEYGVSKDFLNTYVQVDNNRRKRYPLQLSGLNALDFGYKYVYALDTKYIEMVHQNNITENVGMFTDYIHLGTSCKYEGGCNNISPMQNDKMISVKALPAEINLKLWKKQPRDKYSKADMYYRIIFKEL